MLVRLALVGLVLSARPSLADEPAWAFTRWVPVAGNPVFRGAGDHAWDRKIRERGYILVEDGTYHLWYTGYNEDRAPGMALGHATSPDGQRWTRDKDNPLFSKSWVEDMWVVHRDGAYVMLAEGKNDIAHQLTSPDGLHWSDEGSLDIRQLDGSRISRGPYGTPTGWFEDGTWYLFYERGDRGVWLATSKDRKVWKNVQDTPVLALGPDAYDREAVAMNQIVKHDGYYYAFYHANSHRPWKDWTSDVARSKDLVHWEKYPGNPIVKNNCSSPILVRGPMGDRLYTMHPDVKVFEPAPANAKD
jgi:hypothetical protein